MVLYSTNIKKVFNHCYFSIVFDPTYNLIIKWDLIFIIFQFHEFCFKKKRKKKYLNPISTTFLFIIWFANIKVQKRKKYLMAMRCCNSVITGDVFVVFIRVARGCERTAVIGESLVTGYRNKARFFISYTY